MMRTTVLQSIKIFLAVELFVLATNFYSSVLFANMQVAFLSSFLIILGSSYAYKKMVDTKVDSGDFEQQRDLLDTIEDPHELYDKVNDEAREGALGYEIPLNSTPAEELNLKEIVKEERAKIKTFSLSSIKHGARGSVSLFRIIPYLLLILGFIALKNNAMLELKFYLPALILGIIVATIISKRLSWGYLA